ncbi:MAG: hypothetical protein CMK06_05690 [Ponticaulis sp.]|nr:hypothetical protein [Ponticaulis sp.]|tara:strand:+ start:1532 stop:2035 length:504 start_codon:yes stop_codon:yes gene_type:complete
MNFIKLAGLAALTTGLIASAAAQTKTVSEDDLAVLAGDGWAGELVYRAYEPPYEEESIPVKLGPVQATDGGIRFQMIFEGETASGGPGELLQVSEGGAELGGAPIIQRTEIGDSLFVVTRKDCEDDGRAAVCERAFRIGPSTFTMSKEVILDESGERFVRNRYAFQR